MSELTLWGKLNTDWTETWHQQVPYLLLCADNLRGSWTFDHRALSAGMKRQDEEVVSCLTATAIFFTFSPTLSLKIWKPSLLLRISLWRDMKWAHIINISILFDCPPNKSHCSNKQRALLHCLPLSGFELLTLQLTIYYRHLSQVTDKHCDGCMILLCQNGFISPLQATICSELMSCAYSLSSNFPPLLLSHLSDGNRCESYPPKNPFHQEQMYSIIYWFSYPCTLWLLPFSPLYLPQCLCVFLSCMCYVDHLTSI